MNVSLHYNENYLVISKPVLTSLTQLEFSFHHPDASQHHQNPRHKRRLGEDAYPYKVFPIPVRINELPTSKGVCRISRPNHTPKRKPDYSSTHPDYLPLPSLNKYQSPLSLASHPSIRAAAATPLDTTRQCINNQIRSYSPLQTRSQNSHSSLTRARILLHPSVDPYSTSPHQ